MIGLLLDIDYKYFSLCNYIIKHW